PHSAGAFAAVEYFVGIARRLWRITAPVGVPLQRRRADVLQNRRRAMQRQVIGAMKMLLNTQPLFIFEQLPQRARVLYKSMFDARFARSQSTLRVANFTHRLF